MTCNFPDITNCSIGVIGLGYVGLPLAIEIAKTKVSHSSKEKLNREVVGYDLNQKRIEELQNNYDSTNEIPETELNFIDNITYTNNPSLLISPIANMPGILV